MVLLAALLFLGNPNFAAAHDAREASEIREPEITDQSRTELQTILKEESPQEGGGDHLDFSVDPAKVQRRPAVVGEATSEPLEFSDSMTESPSEPQR